MTSGKTLSCSHSRIVAPAGPRGSAVPGGVGALEVLEVVHKVGVRVLGGGPAASVATVSPLIQVGVGAVGKAQPVAALLVGQ
jgi:hypothetical protein